MEENKNAGKPIVPDSDDKLTSEEAGRAIVLLKLDVANVKVEKAKALAYAATCDRSIAELEASIADLERRVVGVKYPEAKPDPAPEAKPVMKDPVGPGAEK